MADCHSLNADEETTRRLEVLLQGDGHHRGTGRSGKCRLFCVVRVLSTTLWTPGARPPGTFVAPQSPQRPCQCTPPFPLLLLLLRATVNRSHSVGWRIGGCGQLDDRTSPRRSQDGVAGLAGSWPRTTHRSVGCGLSTPPATRLPCVLSRPRSCPFASLPGQRCVPPWCGDHPASPTCNYCILVRLLSCIDVGASLHSCL